MNNRKKLAAAKKAYQLDQFGNLWTKPKGSRPTNNTNTSAIAVALAVDTATETLQSACTLQDLSDIQLYLETAGEASMMSDDEFTAEAGMQRNALFTRIGIAMIQAERVA